MGDRFDIFLLIRGNVPFRIEVSPDTVVEDLKEHVIHDQGLNCRTWQIILWKLNHPTPAEKLHPDQNMMQIAVKMFPPQTLGYYFSEKPSQDCIQIVVEPLVTNHISFISHDNNPQASLKGSHEDSQAEGNVNTNFVTSRTHRFLDTIHSRLWGKKDLESKIFRHVFLTPSDYDEAQSLLQPARRLSLTFRDIFPIQSALLNTRPSPQSHHTISQADHGGMDFPHNIISMDLENKNEDMVDDKEMGVPALNIDPYPLNVDISSQVSIPLEVAEGLKLVLPRRISYMDLSAFEFPYYSRLPRLTFIPDTWDEMTRLIDARPQGPNGSVVVTGQAGTGKTCYVHFKLIKRIIDGQTTVFQDIHGGVYVIENGVQRVDLQTESPLVLGEGAIALVDGDGDVCTPHPLIVNAKLPIIVTSTPETRANSWRTALSGMRNDDVDADPAVIMGGWTWPNLSIFMLFLSGVGINLHRLQLTVAVCGMVPRSCIRSAVDDIDLQQQIEIIKTAALGTRPDVLVRVLTDVYLWSLSHIFPRFNAFLYQDKLHDQGFQPVIGLQISDSPCCPVSLQGLTEVQMALTGTPGFQNFGTEADSKWIVLFVVPQHLAGSFRKQPLDEFSPLWDAKVSQYVLGLGDEVWNRSRYV
ncbi:hypothetical protein BDN72DRAFT_431671 [Pluteus cervinus]|uniref:Uncharacterized protein n=1 Tax=Pluteus cervinus TaxID=181527 RepID=A0ACD3B1S5_9AGAR|nr:hypothetical protein BDN72DRAFT_431671 [Pluteus cervinus]